MLLHGRNVVCNMERDTVFYGRSATMDDRWNDEVFYRLNDRVIPNVMIWCFLIGVVFVRLRFDRIYLGPVIC